MFDHSAPKRLLKDTRKVRPRFLTVATYFVVALLIVMLVCLNEFVVSVQDQVRSGQSAPGTPQELIEMQGREDALLRAREPLDTTGTLYRIPIDRAMELIAEESVESGPGQ
jgi:hypothetical protein